MSARPTYTSPAAWFNNAVVTGIQMLYTLQLPRTPAADVLPLTTITWVTALWRMPRMWDQARDTPRLEAAFYGLAGVATEWPAARHLLDHLPPMPPVLALAAPPMQRMTPEQLQRLTLLRTALASKLERMTRPASTPLNRPLTNDEIAQHLAQGGAKTPANTETRGTLADESSHEARGADEREPQQ